MTCLKRRNALYALGVLGVGAASGIASNTWMQRDSKQELSKTQVLMGTFVSISAKHQSLGLLEDGLSEAFATMQHAAAMFTRHDSSSPLGVLNSQGSLRDVPPSVLSLVTKSLALTKETQGSFNPTVAPVLTALKAYGVPSIDKLPLLFKQI